MVRDDAVITFTDTFYSMLFEQNKEICMAFQQAQLNVECSFNLTEANIFKLLLREDVGVDADVHGPIGGAQDRTMRSSGPSKTAAGKLHVCSTFGPF